MRLTATSRRFGDPGRYAHALNGQRPPTSDSKNCGSFSAAAWPRLNLRLTTLQRIKNSAGILAWHATNQEVHHTHPQCQPGQSALTAGASPGAGDQPHCSQCTLLMAEDASQPRDPPQGLENNPVAVFRSSAGAKWALASEDGWYKAAYHDTNAVTGNYYLYPTRSNTAPKSAAPPGAPEPKNGPEGA